MHFVPSTDQRTDKASDEPVNTVQHLAAEEPDIVFQSWWRSKQESDRCAYICQVDKNMLLTAY